ncbi:hypothetical protein P3L10_028027 [Capsicum annuum]
MNMLVSCIILVSALAVKVHCSNLPLKDSTMGNNLNATSLLDNASIKNIMSLSTDNAFRLPSPLPSWPSGGYFASGFIDLGGLHVSQISSLSKVWSAHEGGPDDLGSTFFEPTNLPNGFFMFGSYSQPNNMPLFGWTLAGKDTSGGTLKMPMDYTLVWSSQNLKIKQDSFGYIWLPIPPEVYKAIGHVVITSPQKPSLDKVRCVRDDLTDACESHDCIWGTNGLNVYSSRPRDRGMQALRVPIGAFMVQNNGAADALDCLKNVKANISAMPNFNQVQALVKAYSPLIYFYPDEEYYNSSPTSSNLPQGGSNDCDYWLDLPTNDASKSKVNKGNLLGATAYLHVKPMFGATYTDIDVWLFYPFNGPAKAKLEFMNIALGKIGEHVRDWEHITLRISNFNGELQGVYF